jgi:SHS2 domain-containing protein
MSRSLSLPQPYEELPHVADIRIRVRGDDAKSTLARLILAMAQLQSGGATVTEVGMETNEVGSSVELVLVAIDVLRAAYDRFAADGHIAREVTVEHFGLDGAQLQIVYGRYDPKKHREGLDIKAVTYHAAVFAAVQGTDNYVAEVVFDI